MRYLNKVCFINSAAVKYAEINLNGNVHFIGTQGVGKSTLLRAILFFYNANSLKLGVPSGPTNKSFGEWYFPFRNSYIVYEVQRETGAYFVLAFKAQNRVCYYFVDAPYQRELLVSDEGVACESWEAVRARLDQERIFYSRRIKSFDEYRDILYGNDQGKKEFRRYALLESRQYLNIPRTIQNVFLNSKLDAEFIKQTIIDSMTEDALRIDLQSYSHHLKDFETQLADIACFRQPAVQKQAHRAAELQMAIGQMRRTIRSQAVALKTAVTIAHDEQPRLTELLAAERGTRQVFLDQVEKEKAAWQRAREKLSTEITHLKEKLRVARSREQDYARQNIEDLLVRVAGRERLQQEQRNLVAEKNLLAGQFREITSKYTAILTELENQQQGMVNQQEQGMLAIREAFMGQRDAVRQEYEKLFEDIRDQNGTEIISVQKDLDELVRHKYELEAKKAQERHKRWYETEIARDEEQLRELDQELFKNRQQRTGNEALLEGVKNRQELEEHAIRESYQRQMSDQQNLIKQLEQQLAVLNGKLENSDDSFYGWLNREQPGWENTIGKVCSEDLLFDDSLAPQLVPGSQNSLYGVVLNLQERALSVRSLADYRHEQELLRVELEEQIAVVPDLTRKLEDELQKLKNRLQPKVRALKDENRQLDYEIDQMPQRKEAVQLSLKSWQDKAAEQTRVAVAGLDQRLVEVSDREERLREHQEGLQRRLKRLLKNRERDRDQKIKQLETERDEQLTVIRAQLDTLKESFRKRRAAVSRQQEQELAGKGADTQRLGQIEQDLIRIDVDLEFIENKRDLVAEYYKDKRELFDKVKEFRNQKQLLEQELEQKTEQQERQQQLRQQELAGIDERIRSLQSEANNLTLDLDAFAQFKLSEIYAAVEQDMVVPLESVPPVQGCRAIIDSLKENFYVSIKRQAELKETLDRFLGHFSEANIFSFATHLSGDDDYLRFSEDLTEFIEEDKISEYEKRVNERFGDIVRGLAKETGDLLERTGDIQKVSSKINRDFSEKNFVGAISKIELKLDESANSIFVVLKQIKEFNDQHVHDLGRQDLFSSQNHEQVNEKAVGLLKQLMKEVGRSSRRDLTLTDSFELKFRVEENQNDTGWVEKLANVGSDGTDILVKAMVNIMLLNVFKEGASRRFKNFRLHCMMDEIGKLHPNNVRGILKFANDRNILLINGSPTENNALNYRHIYKISKDDQKYTRVTRILTNMDSL